MWIFTWLADRWDRQKQKTEKILHEFADDHDNSWWAVAIAGSIQTGMNLGAGMVDTLRLGDGVKKGTAGGVLQDGLRLITLLGPAAKLGGRISRVLAIDDNPNAGICAWVSMKQALRQTLVKHAAEAACLK
jgi:hypothetical protein